MMTLVGALLFCQPAHAITDAEFCRALDAEQKAINMDIGRLTDEVTINRGMFPLCGMRQVVFRKEITRPAAAFRDGWQDRRRVQWNQTMCVDPVWVEKIRSGWEVVVEAVFANGVRYSTQAVCR